MVASAVRLVEVRKAFGKNEVLRDISFSVDKSEIVCVIGPSGSGKSTILRCINALTPIDSGSVFVGDMEVTANKVDLLALRRQVGMVFQSYNLFPHWSVLKNITMAPIHVLGMDRDEATEKARALLQKVKLQDKEKAYPNELSGGQQQRVAIARSLCMNPAVMMFDEVTAALDPETVKDVLATIRDVAEAGMTCLIVTHEMAFAREIANTVYFTDHGRIVERGSPKDMFSQPQDPRTKEFLSRVL